MGLTGALTVAAALGGCQVPELAYPENLDDSLTIEGERFVPSGSNIFDLMDKYSISQRRGSNWEDILEARYKIGVFTKDVTGVTANGSEIFFYDKTGESRTLYILLKNETGELQQQLLVNYIEGVYSTDGEKWGDLPSSIQLSPVVEVPFGVEFFNMVVYGSHEAPQVVTDTTNTRLDLNTDLIFSFEGDLYLPEN